MSRVRVSQSEITDPAKQTLPMSEATPQTSERVGQGPVQIMRRRVMADGIAESRGDLERAVEARRAAAPELSREVRG